MLANDEKHMGKMMGNWWFLSCFIHEKTWWFLSDLQTRPNELEVGMFFFSRDSMLEVSSTTYWDVMHTVHGFNPTNNVINGPKTISQKVQGMICDDLPSGYVKIAIENGHWNSWFSRDKLWFSSSLCGSLPEGTGNVQCSLSVDGQCSFSRPRR